MISIAEATQPCDVAPPAAIRLSQRLKARWQAFRLRRRLRATLFTLQALDDRTLSDIGLDRSEIESVVQGEGHERRHRKIEFGGFIARG